VTPEGCRNFQSALVERILVVGIPSTNDRAISGVRMYSFYPVKVFASLSKYLGERRLYSRDENNQIVKDHDRLQDAARCLVSGISRMRTKPKPAELQPRRLPVYHGPQGWMA
jgi:hypothetical protein